MAGIGDVYRLTTVGQWNGEPMLNTLYYYITAVGTGDERVALAAAFDASVRTPWLTCYTSNYNLASLLIQAVKPVGTVLTIAENHAGTTAGNDNVSQGAAVITRKTATPGKGGRGRLFMGPVPLAFTGGANPDNIAIVVNYNTLITALLLILSNTGWSFGPVLWKRKAASALPITAWNLGTTVRTRRSRVIGTRFHRRKKHTVGSI
jgi:hypothetical protein